MVGTIVEGIITTRGTDIDLVTTITMGTVTIMDVVTEQHLDVMDITEIEVSITDIERTDQHSTIEAITVTTEIIDITIITIDQTLDKHVTIITEVQDHVHVQEIQDVIRPLNLSCVNERFYPAIISKIFPTISPPNVPTMYPIIAISTPMGMSALEYAEAKIGAEATPPMFAKEATPKEKRSSLKSFATITIIIT